MSTFGALLLLWLVPVAAFTVARRVAPLHVWCATGVGLGVIASPASLGLYSLYWFGGLLAPWVGYCAARTLAYAGIGGLVLWLFHAAPGFHAATVLGLGNASTIVSVEYVYVEMLNAAVWALVYGTAGFLLDRVLRRARA